MRTGMWLDRAQWLSLALFIGALPFSIALVQISLASCWMVWLARCVRQRRWLGARTPLDFAFAGFLAAALLSTCCSPRVLESLIGLKKFYLLTPAYLLPFAIRSLAQWRRLLLVLTVAMVAAVLWGFTGPKGMPHVTLSPQTMRLTVSGMLMMACALSFGQQLRATASTVRRALGAAATMVLGGFLMVTHELGSMFALACGCLAALALDRRWLLLLVALCLLAGGLAITAAWPAATLQRQDFIQQKTWSWMMRSIIWRTGWEVIKDRPVVGYGWIDLGDFYRAKRAALAVAPIDGHRSFGHLHNILLQVWAMSGAIGLLAFLSMIAAIISQSLAAIRAANGEFRPAILGITAAQLGFLVNGLFEWNFGDSEVVTLFWVLVGLVLSYQRLRGSGASTGPAAEGDACVS